MKQVVVYTVVKQAWVEIEDDEGLNVAIEKAQKERNWGLSQCNFLAVVPQKSEV